MSKARNEECWGRAYAIDQQGCNRIRAPSPSGVGGAGTVRPRALSAPAGGVVAGLRARAPWVHTDFRSGGSGGVTGHGPGIIAASEQSRPRIMLVAAAATLAYSQIMLDQTGPAGAAVRARGSETSTRFAVTAKLLPPCAPRTPI